MRERSGRFRGDGLRVGGSILHKSIAMQCWIPLFPR